ncbi:MAG: serine/threonine protein phosphatase, partial [Clostridiales bacterium]|nr:serine/threonine protein phosphatase [Clostridiales bacterium]
MQSEEDKKIYEHELLRLKMSVESAAYPDNIILFTHYPPILRSFRSNKMVDFMKHYNIHKSVFGHIHLSGAKNVVEGDIDGIEYRLVSCDYSEFMPVKLAD